jgi:hypothetical protein
MKVSRTLLMIILTFAVLLLAAPACNMNAIDTATSKIEEKLAETGSFIPRNVEVTRDHVSIAIEISSGETEFGLYSSWVYLFNIALENAPNVNQVVLELYTLGEPYATLTAQSDDIEEVISEEIDLLTFFSRLEMTDQRPPEKGLRQALASRDWIVTNVTITSKRVDIEAFPPDSETHEEIVMDWFEALHLTTLYAPDSQQTYLHLLLTEQPDLIVMANMEDVRAFQVGEIDAGTFLARLTISE